MLRLLTIMVGLLCTGCDSNLQKKRKMSLSGADKADLLVFAQEARPGFLAKRGWPEPLK
jgi:hypothetical protein